MVTRISSLFVLACLVSGMSFAADDPFCGKWKMNLSKSKVTGERLTFEDLGNNKSIRHNHGGRNGSTTSAWGNDGSYKTRAELNSHGYQSERQDGQFDGP
jgi:hypothetical protein